MQGRRRLQPRNIREFAQVSERLRPLGGRGFGRVGVPGGPGKRAAAPTVFRPGGC